MRIAIVLSLLLTGCAHAPVKQPPPPPMGGVSLIPCDANNCGKPVTWEIL